MRNSTIINEVVHNIRSRAGISNFSPCKFVTQEEAWQSQKEANDKKANHLRYLDEIKLMKSKNI